VIARAAALLALARATLRARRLLRERGARIVIAVGGYASVPAALAAALSRVPVVLVNTDAVPGLANRVLARFATRVFVGWPGAAAAFGAGPRVELSGVPLRESLRHAFGERREEKSRADDDSTCSPSAAQAHASGDACAPRCPRSTRPAAVVHQTGESDRERVEAAWRAGGFDAVVTAFERAMPALSLGRPALCRAGAISVAELALAAGRRR
jgi:UDP-N-acetylglucosamine--N-acetylmuramyl-(pentapeptide) pyrophosphoryl-undecaprenol N-acetylglucosamine transferase